MLNTFLSLLEKITKFKGISTLLIGVLSLIHLTNKIFPNQINYSFLTNIDGIKYLISLTYIIFYCSLSMLILSTFCFYLGLISYEILNKIGFKTLDRINIFAFETFHKATMNIESSLEWIIVSYLTLLIIDSDFKEPLPNIINKIASLPFPLIIILGFSIAPTALCAFCIIARVYKRFFTLELLIDKDYNK